MGIFRIDGPLYKIGNILYYLLISNFLWVIFSLPIVTAGASTTALFYVMGRIVRDDDVSVLKNFWNSFKANFKQAVLVWIILLFVYIILYTNITYVHLLGNISKYILPVQIAILIELVIITIYIFPILSRYNMTTSNLLKTSFYMGNKHLVTTVLCIFSLFIVGALLYFFTGMFILISVSLYALCSYYLIHRVFKKYMPEEKTEECVD